MAAAAPRQTDRIERGFSRKLPFLPLVHTQATGVRGEKGKDLGIDG